MTASTERAARFARFQTVEVPRLRLVGMGFNAAGVLLHNYLVWGPPPLRDAVFVPAVLLGYAALSWFVILTTWHRLRPFDVAEAFLIVDVGVLAYVVYVSGGEASYLWPVFLARPADQVATTYRRAMFFAHLGPLTFLALLLWLAGVDHRPLVWPVEIAKVVFLYFLSLYVALTAKAAEAGRRKLADARRIAEAATLEAEERRRALETALGQLEAASRTKGEFLANVSHELRTPLNSVLGTADLLIDTPLTRDQRDMVGVLRDSADAVTHMVNDILDLARIEARRMPIEQIPLRLREVAGATLRMFSARVAHRPIVLVCHVEPDVPDGLTGDPVRLRQVLTNLIGNAVKFTEAGEIVLTIRRHDEPPVPGLGADGRAVLHFSVRDTGIGIPLDRQAAIFEAFTQVDGSSTRKYGGTGLGLTIANELVALMGGRLWVDSAPGAGSTFHFLARFGTSPAAEAAPWGDRRVSALVVERHAPSAEALAALLRWWGATVRMAPGGHAAMAAADQTAAVDVAFVDADLEGLSAVEVVARLRAAGVPRVLYIVRPPRAPLDVQRAIDTGAAAIARPVTVQPLADALRAEFGMTIAAPPPPRVAARPLRVLVADDHEMNQAVAGAVLKKWGHAVAAAFNGEEALEKLASAPYDVVLMDLQMPILDGLDATRRLRQREAASGAPRVPVIAMTARALEEDRARCLAAGMDDYLSKPLDQQALYDALGRLTGHAPGAPAPAAEDTPETLAPLVTDPDLVRRLAELFLATAPGQLDRLSRALDLGDAAQARSVAHALKGAIAYFAGADPTIAERIEHQCDAGQVERARGERAALTDEVERLSARLRRFLDRQPPS